jgi:hypothetical protein
MIPKANRLIAGIVFLIAFILYLLTMAPTTSFWDCGEFIAASYILGVPHPPGSPLYILVGRLFSLLPISGDIGARVNLISPITSALAVMFLYLIIVQLVKKWRGSVETLTDALITYGAGVAGALTFMVTDSHWFNAVEAEVYATSTFLTALTCWLILRWSEKDEAHSHVHYILLLAYLLGLASGIHLLNLLALPFVALIIYFRRYEFTWGGLLITVAITLGAYLLIHIGLIKGLPQIALKSGEELAVAVVIVLVLAAVWAVWKRQHTTSIVLASLLLVLVGYSTYATIFIRSHHDPAIDENDPETTRQALAYLEREQYGEQSMFNREEALQRSDHRNRYRNVTDFVWNYQFKKMYIRYFLWQFAGRGPATAKGVSPYGATMDEDGVDWFQFGLPLALLIGLFGLTYHLQRDWKHGLAVLALFVATGALIILYVNQPDPQPRERDYSYVGSFLAWSIWIGIGVGGLMELVERKLKQSDLRRALMTAILTVSIVVIPGVMLFANYHEHDRSGNYVAWDYSYNLLNSCEPDAILFTNGDNDTFPLWYLQEVESIRKDVRVVNLSLLNTDWYIRQLRDAEPKIPLRLTDRSIREMTPIQWQTRSVELPVNHPRNAEGKIVWTLKPTFGNNRFLRTQDRMIVQIIKDINWTRPIYFAVTVAPENKIGLDDYLEMQGLVYQLRPYETDPINFDLLRTNLIDVYRYRGLNNPDIYYNENIQRLMQNVRASFLQLAWDGLLRGDREEARAYLDTLESRIPEAVIPARSKEMYLQIGLVYGQIGDTTELRHRLEVFQHRYRMRPIDRLNVGSIYAEYLGEWDKAERIFDELYTQNPRDGEIVGRLVSVYRQLGRKEKARQLLTTWIEQNPGDHAAERLLRELETE